MPKEGKKVKGVKSPQMRRKERAREETESRAAFGQKGKGLGVELEIADEV